MARRHGAGQSYLVQHSAGSGRSNTIAWLAHRLSSLHDADDYKVFDKVVVITDRLVLDRQLQETIYQFERTHGVVAKIDQDSKQLAEALTGERARIVITTIQKFPHVMKHVEELASRRYAVIIDEAHSSQTGDSAKEMKKVLGGGPSSPSATEASLLAAASTVTTKITVRRLTTSDSRPSGHCAVMPPSSTMAMNHDTCTSERPFRLAYTGPMPNSAP